MQYSIQTLQFIAYLSLTFAGVTVAIVSLRLSYRQNFGWKPIVLITEHTIPYTTPRLELNPREFSLKFEIWNRRKYPIVVLLQDLHISNLVLENSSVRQPVDYATTWDGGPTAYSNYKKVRLEPNGHDTFEFIKEAQLSERPQKVIVSISVWYFDPIKNKELKARIRQVIRPLNIERMGLGMMARSCA